MTEDQARAWLDARYPSAVVAKLTAFATLLRTASESHSIIARSTFDTILSRHIVDSAQLVALGLDNGLWVDVGSGGGLPGLVVACIRPEPILLVEPRRKRADFLREAVAKLGLPHVDVAVAKAQQVDVIPSVVSARAVAAIDELFTWFVPISPETKFVLPRGVSYQRDLDIAQRSWSGAFHVEHSIVEPASGIVVASGVAPR